MKKYLFVLCTLFLTSRCLSDETDIYRMKLPITSKVSLMRIGVDPHPHPETGKNAAALVWDAIENHNMKAAENAIVLYDTLMEQGYKTEDCGALKWLCKCILASEDERKVLITDQLEDDFYHFFTDSNYVNLKDYLLRKYKINDFNPTDPEKHLERRTYLEDLIVFNNPRRKDWEKSDEIVKYIDLRLGDRIMDIGCGFGFYSYWFSKIVGNTGKVYAVDASEPYVKYVDRFIKKYNINNMIPVVSKISDVSVNDVVDVAFMCSVYHIVYGWSREVDRTSFINSLKRALRKDGLLVIADNSYAGGKELNNCYLNKELAITQLAFHGFSFINYIQITPQRYLLIFKHEPPRISDFSANKEKTDDNTFELEITSGNSVVHIGSLDSYDITEKGIEGAKFVLEALGKKDTVAAKKAIQLYDNLIPKENFGGEYSALRWFCEYEVAPQYKKTEMLQNPLDNSYYNYLSKDNYKLLLEYVKYKYRLGKEEKKEEESKAMTEEDREIGRTRRTFLEDFILFNNPKREEWEKSSKIMELIPIKKGDAIADIGSGSGYYTYKFSKLVGDGGKVYAIDVKEGHLNYIKDFVKEQKINNIQTVLSKIDGINLDQPVDYAFMCSLYHIIYGVFSEPNRSSFIESIKKVLKKDGRLVIVDNGPVEGDLLPYHGPYITKELIIYQLAFYGFTLEKYDQIIPQRYILTFKLNSI